MRVCMCVCVNWKNNIIVHTRTEKHFAVTLLNNHILEYRCKAISVIDKQFKIMGLENRMFFFKNFLGGGDKKDENVAMRFVIRF